LSYRYPFVPRAETLDRMPRLVLLLVAMAVLFAGCSGTPATTPDRTKPSPTSTALPSQTPSETVDETASPTGTPTPSVPDGRIAPGVTGGGIENVSALLDAHSSGLYQRGFALTTDRTVTIENRTYATERRIVVASNARRLRSHTTSNRSGERTTARSWVDTTMERLLTRVDSGGETGYRIPPIGAVGERSREGYATYLVQTNRIERLLRGGEFEVTGVTERNGTRLYALVATNFSTSEYYDDREVHLYVSAEGTIHVLKATGETAGEDRFAYGYNLSRLGVETVDRPDWVARAPAPVDTRPTLGFENCTAPYLVLENPGPDELPAGSVVSVTSNGTEYRLTLDTGLAADERRALYLAPSGELRTAALGSVPGDRRPLPREAQFTVSTGEGMLLTDGGMGFGCESAGSGGSSSGSEGGASSVRTSGG
jgi:hypothetical protein